VFPFDLTRVVGKKLTCDLPAGEYLKWTSLAEVHE
jgi:hypothetical protein